MFSKLKDFQLSNNISKIKKLTLFSIESVYYQLACCVSKFYRKGKLYYYIATLLTELNMFGIFEF